MKTVRTFCGETRDTQCTVCLEGFSFWDKVTCGIKYHQGGGQLHPNHSHCLNQIFEYNPRNATCPSCKAPIRPGFLRRTFSKINRFAVNAGATTVSVALSGIGLGAATMGLMLTATILNGRAAIAAFTGLTTTKAAVSAIIPGLVYISGIVEAVKTEEIIRNTLEGRVIVFDVVAHQAGVICGRIAMVATVILGDIVRSHLLVTESVMIGALIGGIVSGVGSLQ
ncbi:MAG: hypothetical protein WCF19_04315 [Chlamydiales bacterium]